MNKKTLVVILALICLLAIFYILIRKEDKKELVIFTANASLGKLTIDDKIKESELIVIGEVKTTLPSKWNGHNQKKAEDASPEEIWRAEGLFTDSLISIDQVLKGVYEKPIIRVRTFVGETRQVRWKDSSEPIYEKGKIYLLFLIQDTGPTQIVDPGNYISTNAITAVYEIIDGKAVSVDDEWDLNELIAYIQTKLAEADSTVAPTDVPVDGATEAPTVLPAETAMPPKEAVTPTP